MGRLLLGVAVAVFVIWLVLTVIGTVVHTLVNLLWIIIILALAVWLFRALTGRRRAL